VGFYYLDRVEEGPKRPSTTNSSTRWARQIPVIEDYPYAGISFLRDPDMPMPPGEEHGDPVRPTYFARNRCRP
jgi:hypothetical protein